ncbi:histidinol-phosphate transaminase [Clostridium sp. 19966]|uniref:histidinol-phosphate transaminase n=1 Tax=Clostridium sp. 19966 TaxID=2768166 RepID=UPI0028DF373C|nr:histidinol-phosphate transaminase [Clostridium sp. 19966]MDT8715508.1 histidinol-phosphate transaminase [Clostridium sp. 19966]
MGKISINEKLKKIQPYIMDKNKYNVKLDANESFLEFPKELKEELFSTIDEVLFNRYPDPDAEEICRLYGEYCGTSEKNIMPGNGSDDIIQTLCNGFLESGDKILTLKPDFSMYKFYASIIGASSLEYDMGENLIFHKEAFVKLANDNAVKLIIFSNPNNPTGNVIKRDDILYVVKNCDALVVADEAYYEFYGETVIDCIYEYENLAVLRTCSKAFGLAGLRVGFLIAGDIIIENAKKVKPPYNVNSLSQAAAKVMLSHPEIIRENIKRIKEERNYLYEKLLNLESKFGKSKLKVYPTGANFIYIRTVYSQIIFESLRNSSIIVRNFGENLRVNAGTRKENGEFIEALEKLLAGIGE